MAIAGADSRAPANGWRKTRGWGRLWQMPTLLVGALCLAVTAATADLRDDPSREFVFQLRTLRRQLRDENKLAQSQSLVEKLDAQAAKFPRFQGECAFLTGSYFFLRGEYDLRDLTLRANAQERLTQALALGVPDADVPTLYYRLGMTDYRRGQHQAQALAWIKQGLDMGADHPALGYAYLVDAHLKMAQPNLEAALAASMKYREYVDDRNLEALGKARYTHADILCRLDRRTEAIRELEAVDPRVAPELRAKVVLLQATCAEQEGQWTSALRYWSVLDGLVDHVPGGTGRVHYAIGNAELRVQPPDVAAAEANWRKAVAGTGEDAQAAALRLGQLLVSGERYEPEEAASFWKKALGSVRVPEDFKNSRISAPAAVALLEEANDRLVERGDFERSTTLNELIGRIAPHGVAEEKRAQTYSRWAKALVDQAEHDADHRKALESDAWLRYQNAGEDFEQAALSRCAKEKIELYWRSAECYLAGHDYVKAAMVLEKFVASAADDPRRAQGLFRLAETYQTLNRKPEARVRFHKCIELNLPPYDNLARQALAHLEISDGNRRGAREILDQILQHVDNDLPRKLYEEALFELANLLYDLGEYDEASYRLREAIRRFPNNPTVLAARDRLGEYYWDKKARKLLVENAAGAAGGVVPPLPEALRERYRENLAQALAIYRDLERDLKEQSAQRGLDPAEAMVRQKALFSIGCIRMALEEYEDAFEYFRVLQLDLHQRKQHVPALYAAGNAYSCWKKMPEARNARSARFGEGIEIRKLAVEDLRSIPTDRDEDFFRDWSREQWEGTLRSWEEELHVTLRVNPHGYAPQD
jgi:tetratricopeptide (TPR) repeat protein